MRLIAASLCALALAPAVSVAEMYVDLGLLGVLPADETVSNTTSGAPGTGGVIDLSNEAGYGFTVAVGSAGAGKHRGVEVEFGFRETPHNKFSTPDGYPLIAEVGNPDNYASSAPASGDTSITSLMLNTYGQFGEGGLNPYLGAGLGVAVHSVDVTTAVGVLKQVHRRVSDQATVFAWQVMAGVSFETFRAGYRYFATADTDIDGLEVTHGRHAFEVGLTFR